MEVEVHAPPVETKPSINFDKKAPVQEEVLEDEDILGDFDLSMDSLDEDRDTTTKK